MRNQQRMFIECLLGIALGVCIGIITGLIPGLHVNLASLLFVSFFAGSHVISGLAIVLAVTAMMVTHTVFDFLPAVFLGAPDESTALCVLPGHFLLLRGRGLEAVFLSVVGLLGGALIATAVLLPLLFLLPLLSLILEPFMGVALAGLVMVMILREKKKLWALIVVVLAGSLGVAVFSSSIKEPLLPMLSGLFGISVILGNASEEARIPPQLMDLPRVGMRALAPAALVGTLSGALLNVFPGVGPSQASIISLQTLRVRKPPMVIVTVSAVGAGSLFGSLAALLALGKARNAPLVYMGEVISFDYASVALVWVVSLAVLAGCALMVLRVCPIVIAILARLPYKALSVSILVLILAMVLWQAGPLGLFVLLVSTSIGLATHYSGIGKHHLMACLLIPTISYFLL